MIKVLRLLFMAVGIIVIPIPVKAQLTLDECQNLAQKNYPLLKQYRLIEETTGFTIQNINRGYLPQLTLNGQGSFQSDVMTLPDLLAGMLKQNGYVMKGLDKDQYRLALDLNQIVWDGGNLKAQKEMARTQGDVQNAQMDVEMYKVRERVNSLFFGLLLIKEKILLNEDLQKLLSANCDKLQEMLQNGVAMQADVDAVRAEYLNARQQRIELDAMKQTYQRMLALFIGKEIEAVDGLQRPADKVPVSSDNQRPELQLFNAQISQTEAQRQLLNSGIRPKLGIFAQGYYGYPGYNMFADMFNHDFTWNGMVGVRIQWNISNMYTHKNEHRKLDVVRGTIENTREAFLFNNRLQTIQETADIERYRNLLVEDEEIILLRTSVRKSAEAKLEHGIIDVNNLLQEITRENQARIEKSGHEIEMLKHIYELKHTINQ